METANKIFGSENTPPQRCGKVLRLGLRVEPTVVYAYGVGITHLKAIRQYIHFPNEYIVVLV